MKTLKSIVLYFTILLSSIATYSQITSSQELLNDNRSISSFDYRSKDLVGSSYIDKDFLPAKLSVDGTIYSMRFDAYKDEMEVEKENNKFYLKHSFDYTVTFLGTNKVYQVYKYQEKDLDKTGFFVVLFNGDKVSLLLKEKIQFYEEVIAKTGYDKYKPPSLKRENDKLYIGYKNNVSKELPKKKNDILKLFSSKSKNIETFAKKNKLGFKKKEDLVKIFTHYSSLK